MHSLTRAVGFSTSQGMRDLDDLMLAKQGRRADTAELDAIVAGLHRLEETTRSSVVELINAIAADLAPVPSVPASRNLSAEQEAALWAAGSFVDEMPPIAERASTKTAQRVVTMIAAALTTEEAAARLGVSASRIRQRLGERTLLAVKIGPAHRLPAFQFTADGELPGWGAVASTVPENAHLVSVDRFMGNPHPDLTAHGEVLSPIDWLTEGGAPGRVRNMIHTAFVVRAS
jgi:excisionase family DNA binding protein